MTSGGICLIAEGIGYSGSYAVARDLFRQIADAHENDSGYGPDNTHTLNARLSLAYWTGQAGDPAGARDLYAELLPIFERVRGAEHPETLTTRANLAFLTGQMGDPAGARDLFAELLPIRERVQGAEHPDTVNTRGNLAYWTVQANRGRR